MILGFGPSFSLGFSEIGEETFLASSANPRDTMAKAQRNERTRPLSSPVRVGLKRSFVVRFWVFNDSVFDQ